MSMEKCARAHNVIIEQREKINMSGVCEVLSFEDETIILNTDDGRLTIKGENLKIGSFSTSSGEIDITGRIRGFVYSEEQERSGFFRRLMR